jgi:hypothetical protein
MFCCHRYYKIKKAKIVKNKLPQPKMDNIDIQTENKMTIAKVISNTEIPKIINLEKKSDSSIKLGSMYSCNLNLNETRHNAIATERQLNDLDKEMIKNVLQDHFLFKDQYDKIMYILLN